MRQSVFENEACQGTITEMGQGDLVIHGTVNNIKDGKLYFWAAAPPTHGTSFSGSGMPYPNPVVAFDNTPNRGVVELSNGSFEFNIHYPNAYYVGLGSLYVPPHINLKLCRNGEQDKYFSITIDDGIPFRTLTYPAPPSNKPRISPMFYHECDKGARSQEAILRASAYPSENKMPENFWGDRPPR